MNTATITIPQKKYQELVNKALRYDYFQSVLKEDLFASPPTRSAKAISTEFAATGQYSAAFIKSLQQGLERSDYYD